MDSTTTNTGVAFDTVGPDNVETMEIKIPNDRGGAKQKQQNVNKTKYSGRGRGRLRDLFTDS